MLLQTVNMPPGIDVDGGRHIIATEGFVRKDNRNISRPNIPRIPVNRKNSGALPKNAIVVENKDDNLLNCANSCEDDTFRSEVLFREQCRELKNKEDASVDVTDRAKTSSSGLFVNNSNDGTEGSSSFSDDDCESEDGPSTSGNEVNSKFCGESSSALALGEHGEAFLARKKLTDHWKRFIHHIEWRCKWIELRRKRLHSKVSRYERELAQCDWRKQIELQKLTAEEDGTNSTPFLSRAHRTNIMKRKRRKRMEEEIDISSHISKHNLFSYFENKKSFANGTNMDGKCTKRVIPKVDDKNDEIEDNEECPILHMKDDAPFEHLLWKLTRMQAYVQNLRFRIEDVERKIPDAFAPINIVNLLAKCNGLVSSQDISAPPFKEDEEDLLMPDSATTRYGELSILMNVSENTDKPHELLFSEEPGIQPSDPSNPIREDEGLINRSLAVAVLGKRKRRRMFRTCKRIAG